MRFYIMTDLEGVSGVIDFDSFCFQDSKFYDKAKRLLTQEINASVEGILNTGDHEIVVCDGHGAGAVDIELLHKEAQLIIGRPLDYMFEMDKIHYDAFLMIGQHAMKNAPCANLDHTYNHETIKSLHINGILMGEAGVNALRAGIFDIPTIFLSGDHAACKEISSLIPNIHTCSVKQGISSTSALCLQPEKAREKIKLSVAKAVEFFSDIKPYKLTPPFEAIFEFYDSNSIKPYLGKSYCEIINDNKVFIYSDSMKELLLTNLWGL